MNKPPPPATAAPTLTGNKQILQASQHHRRQQIKKKAKKEKPYLVSPCLRGSKRCPSSPPHRAGNYSYSSMHTQAHTYTTTAAQGPPARQHDRKPPSPMSALYNYFHAWRGNPFFDVLPPGHLPKGKACKLRYLGFRHEGYCRMNV